MNFWFHEKLRSPSHTNKIGTPAKIQPVPRSTAIAQSRVFGPVAETHREIESFYTHCGFSRKFQNRHFKAILQNKCPISHRPWCPFLAEIPFVWSDHKCSFGRRLIMLLQRMGNKTKTWPNWPQLVTVQVGRFHLFLLIEKLGANITHPKMFLAPESVVFSPGLNQINLSTGNGHIRAVHKPHRKNKILDRSTE